MNSKPTHILYIAEFSTGGSVESLLCLAGGLDKTQYEATVLFYSLPDQHTCDRFEKAGVTIRSLYPRSSEKGKPRELRKLSLQARIRRLFGTRIERYYETLKYAIHFVRFRRPVYAALCREIESIQPDLVHLNNGVGTDTPGILAARKIRVPAVCHLRTLGKLTHISIAASRSVNALICISNAVRDVAINQGVDARQCVVVPNAVDLTRFSSAHEATKDVREEFGWETTDTVFALVGRVVSWKGQNDFIRALAKARKSDSTLRGLIVGDGDGTDSNDLYIDGLHKLIDDLNLKGSVILTGQRTDIPQIMSSADVVVCPSSEPEPFGRVIIEGMAVGTTVIATDAGGASDIIQNNVNGILVPVKNSHALSEAMTRLSGEKGLSERLNAAAIADANELYTIEKHVDIICQLYSSALKSR